MSETPYCIMAMLLATCTLRASEPRIWADKTGKYEVSAALVEFRGREVVLKKAEDGSRVVVAAQRLSENDVEWLKKNAQPKVLMLPPVRVDLKTLDAGEVQRVDLSDALRGLDDFAIVAVAVNGEPVKSLEGDGIRRPGDAIEFELSGSPGATIELQRGGGEQARTLMVRPRLLIQPEGARVVFSSKSLSETQRTLQAQIVQTRRDLQQTQQLLADLPGQLAAAQRRAGSARADAERMGWLNQAAELSRALKVAQGKLNPLQSRLASLPAREQHADAAVKWLNGSADKVVLTFRVETVAAENWSVPVIATWAPTEATTLGALGDLLSAWRCLPHQWRNEARVGDRQLKAFADQFGSELADRLMGVRFKVTDVAVDANGTRTLGVSPVEHLAGVDYPETVAATLVSKHADAKVGDVVVVSGKPTIHCQQPRQEAAAPFRRIGERADATHAPPPRTQAAPLTLRLNLPGGAAASWTLWLQIAPIHLQGEPKT